MKRTTCWICEEEKTGPGDGVCEGECGRPVCLDHIVGHGTFMVCSVCSLKAAVSHLKGDMALAAKKEIMDQMLVLTKELFSGCHHHPEEGCLHTDGKAEIFGGSEGTGEGPPRKE